MKFDELIIRYFDNPEQFADAMKLLYQVAGKNLSLEDYEELGLDDRDDWLLGKAENLNEEILEGFQKLQNEVLFLKEALTQVGSGFKIDPEKLVSDFTEKLNEKYSDDENPLLSDYRKEWMDANRDNLVATTYQSTYLPAVTLFVNFILDYNGGDIRISEIKPEHIRQYQKFYSKIPKHIKTSKFTISELMKLEGESKLPKTIKDNFATLGSFINWGRKKGYPFRENLTLILTQGSDVKVTENTKKKRTVYSDDELKIIFNSVHYRQGNFKTSGMYWVPLISLFTGARMSEILQLEKNDIKKSGKYWVFDFNEDIDTAADKNKRLKASGSKRQVPIHEQLIKLGFLDYLEQIEDRVFPDEPRNIKGKFDAFSKRQGTFRKQVGIKKNSKMEMKDFHTFRHTTRTKLAEIRTTGRANQRFDEGLIDAIVGHESKGRSIGEKNYNHTQYIEAKHNALRRLEFDSIDFKKIVKWDKCEFYRKPFQQKFTKKIKN